MMKITILCENVAGHHGRKICLAEWGFSAFIQTADINLLFDTGHTDVYWKNAEQLGINLENTHFVILSHFHWDHTGGLRFHNFQSKKKLVTHPEVLEKLPADESAKLKKDFALMTSKEPLEFAKDIIYLGEIPRENDFEIGSFADDNMRAGICNICEYGKKVSGQPLYAVIGGFHLFAENQKSVDKTMDYFKAEKPTHLLPMHCVDFPTQAKFYTNFATKKYSAGDIIDITTS